MKGINWEIGSTWYADDFTTIDDYAAAVKQTEHDYDVTLLSACRSAIGLIIDKIGPNGRAVVPSFTCHSVTDPFISAGYKIRGYHLTENLQIDSEALLQLVDEFCPDILFVHGYFGFDTLKGAAEILRFCRRQCVTVIDDRTQTMFSTVKPLAADYTIGSIRKWLPIPDGAFLKGMRCSRLVENYDLAKAKLKAMVAKNQYITRGIGIKSEFMQYFTDAEKMFDATKSPHAISGYSLSALNRLDLKAFAERRRENYNVLARRLSQHPEISLIFSEALRGDVPFLLPVFIDERRADFQTYMARHNVYPTIIWKCPEALDGIIDSESRRIYDRILCFHIDQRYDTKDMEKVADIVDSYLPL